MAIITEYTNYANTDIPYFKRDDLRPLIVREETVTLSFNGRTSTFKAGSMSFDNDRVVHFSNYYAKNTEGALRTEFAIKSKNENSKYNYYTFHYGFNGRSVTMGMRFTNDINDFTNVQHITSVTTTGEGEPRFSIVEVGEYIGIFMTRDGYNAYNQYMGVVSQYNYIEKRGIEELLGKTDYRTYDDEYGGISDADGYNPNFDNSSDIIPVPNMPIIGVSNVGFVNVYNTTQGALQNLGADIFPDFEEIPDVEPDTDTLTMLANGFQYLGKNITTLLKSYINSNLINYIIDCHCLPVTPTTGGSENIKIGFKEFQQTAMRVTSDYVDFDCGTLNLKEYYGNFIDYVGTRASLYLPFIGFVPIKNEYFQNGALTVKYRFNIIDGSFMCFVLATSSKSNLKNTVIGTYSGNACVHIPITGVNYSNMVSGVVSGVSGAVVGGMSGNVGMAVGSALSTLSCKPEMQSSNSYNATSSFLGIRYPYLLIEREVSNFSELYPSEYGVPLNVTKSISELTGYVEMDENIHIELNCMNEEKEMLKELLTNGIII